MTDISMMESTLRETEMQMIKAYWARRKELQGHEKELEAMEAIILELDFLLDRIHSMVEKSDD